MGNQNPMNLHLQGDAFLSGLARHKDMPGEETLSGVEQKRMTSRMKLQQLKQGLKDRPELHGQIDDLEAKMAKQANLIGQLRYSMEYRHELKRMGLTTQDVRGAIPSRDTPFGQTPAFIVGVVDSAGEKHWFQRPVRVRK